MDIERAKRIQINALLTQREAGFCRVHEIEQRIEEILGAPYPFPPPPPLPSQAKRKKLKKASNSAKPKPFVLPPLKTGESAYRITYLQDGFQSSEEHLDSHAITLLINQNAESIRVIRVETIDLSQSVLRVLYAPDL